MKFSVVVCTHNYAHLLPDALRTVAAQTVQDFELLIVDDGSTDNTAEVVEQFRPQFQDCRYLKKPHSGPADSRNVGVLAAMGTHIAFLDADDLWSHHYLAAMQKVFSENPQADLALCEAIFVRGEKGMATEASLNRGLPQLSGRVCSSRELFKLVQAFSPSGMVLTKGLYNRNGPFNVQSFGWFSEDVDWVLRALTAEAFCVCLKERLYLYRRHENNLTNNAGNSFQSWLTIYSQTLRESRAKEEIERLARGVLRSRVLRFLPTCSTSRGRLLLKEALETLGGDPYVRFCYLGTFVGLPSLLRLLKQAKSFLRHRFRKGLAIDLSASSEALFETVNDPPS